MSELIVILVGTVLVNNFVLVRFLGLCPFMGVSRNLEAATGMSLATAFVLTLSSATAFIGYQADCCRDTRLGSTLIFPEFPEPSW